MTAILPTAGGGATSPIQSDPSLAKRKAEIQSMAADFEAIFVRQMLTTMRSSSLGEGLFDGEGLEQFRDMQDAKLAESMAQRGVFGVAELLTRHMEKLDV